MSKYDFEKIKNEYMEGDVTLCSLSEKYGVPKATLYAKSSIEGWGKDKKELLEKGDTQTSDVAVSGAVEADALEMEVDAAAIKNLLSDGIESREKFMELRRISEVLTEKISRAVFDEYQFNRYIVNEKGTDENGKAVNVTTEKCFDKLDTKALKEMTGTLKTLTECVRNLYGIPTFSETARLYLANKGDDDESGEETLTVSFMDCEEFAQ